jgi:hypothetical protein
MNPSEAHARATIAAALIIGRLKSRRCRQPAIGCRILADCGYASSPNICIDSSQPMNPASRRRQLGAGVVRCMTRCRRIFPIGSNPGVASNFFRRDSESESPAESKHLPVSEVGLRFASEIGSPRQGPGDEQAATRACPQPCRQLPQSADTGI